MKLNIFLSAIIIIIFFGCFQENIIKTEKPVFKSKSGTYQNRVVLNLTSDTKDAIIIFTIDGTEPSKKNGEQFKTDKEITTGCTVKARAFKTGLTDSDIVSETYVIRNDFIKVEGAPFLMGDNTGGIQAESYPQHQVVLTYNFYLSKYETNQKDYYEIYKTNPSHYKGENLPVEQISWWDAIKYCNARSKIEGYSPAYNETTGEILTVDNKVTTDITLVKGYRLPTEAEWEFAAKGGKNSKSYKYSGSNNLDMCAWYFSNSSNTTHNIAEKVANELGLYDMSGNVWEWCSDYKENYTEKFLTNPYIYQGDYYNKIIRGGACNYGESYSLTSSRMGIVPNSKYFYVGMRLARTE